MLFSSLSSACLSFSFSSSVAMDGGPCGHDDGGDAFATGTKRDHQHLSLGGHDDPEAGPAETKRPRLEEDDDADATRGQRAGRGAFAAHDDHDDERDEEEDTQDYDEDDRDEDEDWEEGSRGSDEDNSFETDPNASFDVYDDDDDDDDDDDEINGDDSLDAIEGYEDEDDETAAERKRAAEGLRSSARIKAIKESGPRTTEREGEASSSGLRQRSKSGKRKSKSKKTEGEESKGNGRERNRDRERERRRRRKRESARRFNANLESTSAAMAARRKELEEAEAKRAAQRNEQNFSWIFEDMSIEAVDQRRKEILEDWRFFSALHFLEKFGLVLDIPKTITLGNDFLEAFIGSFGIDGFQHVHSLHIHLLKHLKFRPIDLSSSTSTRQTLDPDTNETKTFTEAGWHRSMRIMVKRHYLDFPEGNPLESCPYNQLKLSDRVSLLHMLCEWITYDSSLIRDCLERTKIDDQFHVCVSLSLLNSLSLS